jgi:hypothetical protein
MKRALLGALLATALVAALPSAVSADAEPVSNPASQAWFEDHWIDLSVDWEEAKACNVGLVGNVCFRTEAQLDEYLRSTVRQTVSGISALLVTCSSTLRLYEGVSYGGLVLVLNGRGVGYNMSTYGFDNVTSSYKVGACAAEFYAGANLSGSSYPGNTAAGAQAASMLVGWNNVVSSVIIF